MCAGIYFDCGNYTRIDIIIGIYSNVGIGIDHQSINLIGLAFSVSIHASHI